MRQKFDIGDLVQVRKSKAKGIVLETKPINKNIKYPNKAIWHTDEYKCKIRFITADDGWAKTNWVRAKWLEHLSKISE